MKNMLQRLKMWNVQPQLLMVSDWVAGGFRAPALPQCGFQNNIGSQKISPFVFFIQTRFKFYIKQWNCNVRMFIFGFGPERSLRHTQHFWHNQKEEQEERDLQKPFVSSLYSHIKKPIPMSYSWSQGRGSSGMLARPAASVSPGNVLEIQILRPYSRPTESETPGMRPSKDV